MITTELRAIEIEAYAWSTLTAGAADSAQSRSRLRRLVRMVARRIAAAVPSVSMAFQSNGAAASPKST